MVSGSKLYQKVYVSKGGEYSKCKGIPPDDRGHAINAIEEIRRKVQSHEQKTQQRIY
jgi:hypothetical protein